MMTGCPFFAGVIYRNIKDNECAALNHALGNQDKALGINLPWLQTLQYDSQFSVDLSEHAELTCLSQDQNQA